MTGETDPTGTAAMRPAVRMESRAETVTGAVLLLMFLLLALVMRAAFTGGQNQSISGDAVHYIRMAQEPFANALRPFGLRLLTPALVRVVHEIGGGRWGWDFAWTVVTFAGLFMAGMGFRLLLVAGLRLTGFIANLFTIGLVFNYCYALYLFENPFLVDPLNNAAWALALYWLFTDRFGRFAVTVGLGALNKEVILVLVPLYPLFMLMRHGSPRHRAVLRSVGVTGAVLALYVVYCTVVAGIVYGGEPDQNALTLQETLVSSLGFQKDVWLIYSVFHFFWLIFALTLHELHGRSGWRNRYLVSSVYLLIALTMGRLFATDADRVFVMAAPLVLGLAAVFLSARMTRGESRLLIVLILASAAQHSGWLHDRQVKTLLDLAIMLVFVAWWRRFGLDDVPEETLRELDRV